MSNKRKIDLKPLAEIELEMLSNAMQNYLFALDRIVGDKNSGVNWPSSRWTRDEIKRVENFLDLVQERRDVLKRRSVTVA